MARTAMTHNAIARIQLLDVIAPPRVIDLTHIDWVRSSFPAAPYQKMTMRRAPR
jgi:hypothetical protein